MAKDEAGDFKSAHALAFFVDERQRVHIVLKNADGEVFAAACPMSPLDVLADFACAITAASHGDQGWITGMVQINGGLEAMSSDDWEGETKQ